jgi:lysophospholipase L1-like esterase
MNFSGARLALLKKNVSSWVPRANGVAPYAIFALQRVIGEYSGPVVRLRRASDGAVQDFGFAADGKLSRSQVLAWAGASRIYVSIWYDQSGNGHDAAQTTLLNQPDLDVSSPDMAIAGYDLVIPRYLRLTSALNYGRNKAALSCAALVSCVARGTQDFMSAQLDAGGGSFTLRAQGTPGNYALFARRVNGGNFALPTSSGTSDGLGWKTVVGEARFLANSFAVSLDGVRTVSGTIDTANTPDVDAANNPTILAGFNGAAPFYGFTRAAVFFQDVPTTPELAYINTILTALKPQNTNRYIAGWGDSLTAGGYVNYLGALFGGFRTVYDGGVGGESAASIRARQVADEYRNDRINLLWAGRNGFKTIPAADIKADIDLMIAHVEGGRWLVGGITPFADDTGGDTTLRLALNALLSSAYGNRYVDILTPMQAANDGSANDLADVAAGLIPRSLRGDGGHPNETGKQVNAVTWRDAILAQGW